MGENTKNSESMLVRSEDLDKLLMLAGEVIIASSNQELTYKALQNLHDHKEAVNQDVLVAAKDLSTSTSLLSTDLHRLVQTIRTVSLKDLGFRARRLVRDIARKTGKRVNFEIIGEETTIDKAIVEKLYDPISHQLRNAVDHGIEDIRTRKEANKPEEGSVTLRAYNTENETFIEIEDDGKGIDMDALRERAIAKGQFDKDRKFTPSDALELMCTPGFTTTGSVSDVSGRGVGMDVVKTQMDRLGGSITLNTEAGKGTTFTFRIPLVSAVNIVDALVVRANDNVFAFPINSVVASISVKQEQINTTLDKGHMVKHLNQLLPLYSLVGVLEKTPELADWKDKDIVPVLIIEHKNKKIALGVSEFLSPQKLVIIPFNEKLTVTGLVGSTILGGRKLGFIVDVPSLIELSKGKEADVVLQGDKELLMANYSGIADKENTSVEMTTEVVEDDSEIFSSSPSDEDTEEDMLAIFTEEFVMEMEKLIPELNEAVFALEKNYEDEEQINNAFRLLHTIKGNLMIMGFPKFGETVHSVESVLDRARGHEIEMTPEVIDILMDIVSFIEDGVKKCQNGVRHDEHSDDIISRCQGFMPQEVVEHKEITEVKSAEIEVTHEAAYRLVSCRRRGVPFYRLYVEFESGTQPNFLVACLIYKRVCEVGDILGSVPMLPNIESGYIDNCMKMLFASNWEPDKLEKSLTNLLTTHYGVTKIELQQIDA